jgi:hypothetical protein
MVATLGFLAFGRGPARATVEDAVGTTGTPVASAAGAGTVSGTGSGAVTSVPAPAAQPSRRLLVTLDVRRTCWVAATADGQRAVYALLEAGARETLSGTREIVVRAGDAGALDWTVNGRNVGAFGKAGEVRTVKITPDNAGSLR